MALNILGLLADLFPDEITVTPFTSDDALGAVALGSSTTYAARCVMREVKVRAADGQQVVSRVQCVIASAEAALSVNDHYTLPSRFNLTTPTAIAISFATDENGAHHQRVYF